MTNEPEIQEDGRCVLPSCHKVITTVSRWGDPDAFCSTACCREWYGIPLPKPVPGVAVGASS